MSDDDELVRRTFEVEGRADHVRTIEFVLQWIAQCGAEGATRMMQLMVDGDGQGIVELLHDGQSVELAGEERAFAMGERKELPASLAELCAQWQGDVLQVDLA